MLSQLKTSFKRRAILASATSVLVVVLFLWASRPPSETDGAVTNKNRSGTAPVTAGVLSKISRAEALKAIGQMNEVSMTFYGKVIDQDGNPVAHADVGGATLFNNMLSHGKRDYDTVSDANGYFVFPSIKGRDFNCTPRKEGYVYWPAKNYNGYVLSNLAPQNERFVPDPEKPEIFRMWKSKGAEVLLCSGGTLYIPPDGSHLYIDMKTRKQSTERGDVAFWCRYQVVPETTDRERNAVEWEFGITVIGGGVIITDSRLPFEAPADGYQERWSHGVQRGNRGSGLDSPSFYLKTSDGNYAVFNIEVINNPSSPKCSMGIGWKLNPSGSRNLEPGKEQMLKKGSYMKPGDSLEQIRLRD